MLTVHIKQKGWNISFPFVSKSIILDELNNIHEVYTLVANKSKLPFKKLQPFMYKIKGTKKIVEEGSIFLRPRQFVLPDGTIEVIDMPIVSNTPQLT